MSVRVQFVLTDEEYEQLKKMVADKNITISKFVKDKVFPKEDSFEIVWKEFLDKLDIYPDKKPFDVSQVMIQERWKTLDKSTKLSIARLFNRKVAAEQFKDKFTISHIGRSPSNVSLYQKTLLNER